MRFGNDRGRWFSEAGTSCGGNPDKGIFLRVLADRIDISRAQGTQRSRTDQQER